MFCRKCGAQIPEDSAFCYKCGASVEGAEVPAADAGVKTYTLTIDRASQVYLINPPVKVEIDGTIRLSVDNGKCETVELEEGHHVVDFTSSFRRTVIDFDMNRDTVIQLSWGRISGKLKAEIV